MDIAGILVLAGFVTAEGIIVGKRHRRLMLEEEAAKMCSPSMLAATG